MKRRRAFAGWMAVAAATAAVVWGLGSPGAPDAAPPQHAAQAAASPTGSAGQRPSARPMESSFFTARRASRPDQQVDPLLVQGLRDTLEALLTQAGDADDPSKLKQRLAALVDKHFPAALAVRALALAERYVDYRVALGQLRAPLDASDPRTMRDALEARHRVRQQFFDGDEYDALFAREAELDRYTLARLEIAHNTQLTPEQRALALSDAETELPEARRAERAAATEHMNAAAQTAAFNAQNADAPTRYAARSAQYGEAAAQALAQLDREEQNWQQRLDQYSRARAQRGDGAAVQQLRQQLFSSEEQLRVDAALALRRTQPAVSGS